MDSFTYNLGNQTLISQDLTSEVVFSPPVDSGQLVKVNKEQVVLP